VSDAFVFGAHVSLPPNFLSVAEDLRGKVRFGILVMVIFSRSYPGYGYCSRGRCRSGKGCPQGGNPAPFAGRVCYVVMAIPLILKACLAWQGLCTNDRM